MCTCRSRTSLELSTYLQRCSDYHHESRSRKISPFWCFYTLYRMFKCFSKTKYILLILSSVYKCAIFIQRAWGNMHKAKPTAISQCFCFQYLTDNALLSLRLFNTKKKKKKLFSPAKLHF